MICPPAPQIVALELREKIKILFLHTTRKFNHSAFFFHSPQGKTEILERTEQLPIDHRGRQGRKARKGRKGFIGRAE